VAAAAMRSGGMAVADASLDPADCSWVAVANASAQKAIQQLPECLARWASCRFVEPGWLAWTTLFARHTHTCWCAVRHGVRTALLAAVPHVFSAQWSNAFHL
jgi:hypothetical protein